MCYRGVCYDQLNSRIYLYDSQRGLTGVFDWDFVIINGVDDSASPTSCLCRNIIFLTLRLLLHGRHLKLWLAQPYDQRKLLAGFARNGIE
jgi:hypothetical protein